MPVLFASLLSQIKKNWLLLSIFLLALVLRTVWLETLPATFFVDEVLSGYLGRYLWLNGQDLYGNIRPWLYFNKFGDYYILLPMYLDGLSTFIFGVTRFATRFPTALIGALAVFPLFGISWHTFRHRTPALLSALLVAVMPWHIVLSRATTESIIEMTVLLTLVWVLLVFAKNQSKKLLVLAVGMSLLSYLLYHTARILVPLIWIGYLLSYSQIWFKQKHIAVALLAICLGFLGLTGYVSQTEWGRGRFEQTSLFSAQSGVAIRMNEMTYNLGNDSVLLARFFHNKVLGFGREFLNQYLSYYDPSFLWSADSWMRTRYAVSEVGPLYLSCILMLLAWVLPSRHRLKMSTQALLMLGWVCLIAPLPTSLTVIESPNLRRSVFMLAPLLLLAGAGWYRAWGIRWKMFSLGLGISLLLFGEFILFAYHYTTQSDFYSSLYRSDGWPEVAEYLLSQPAEHTYMVVDSVDFPLYYLFAKEDFAAKYAQQFGFELRIDRMDSVLPRSEKCAIDIDRKDIATESATFIIEPDRCDADPCRFVAVDQITGVNQLTKLRVLKALSLREVPKSCTLSAQ